jgi:hypothetical protein
MQPPTNMAHMPIPFSSNQGGDKRGPPYGGPPMMGQPGQFPSSMMSMFPTGMPNMTGMPMSGMSMGGMSMGGMSHFGGMRAMNQLKEQEFEKGLFVEDFEETVTGEMLYKHFNSIKPVSIIKFPTTK